MSLWFKILKRVRIMRFELEKSKFWYGFIRFSLIIWCIYTVLLNGLLNVCCICGFILHTFPWDVCSSEFIVIFEHNSAFKCIFKTSFPKRRERREDESPNIQLHMLITVLTFEGFSLFGINYESNIEPGAAFRFNLTSSVRLGLNSAWNLSHLCC